MRVHERREEIHGERRIVVTAKYPRHFDQKHGGWAGNAGWMTRHRALESEKVVEVMVKLHVDLTRQTKYLPNGCKLKFKLTCSSPQFYLIGSDQTGRIEILEAVLRMRTVTLNPEVSVQLNQHMRQEPIKIPVNHVEIKTFTVLTGLQSRIESVARSSP